MSQFHLNEILISLLVCIAACIMHVFPPANLLESLSDVWCLVSVPRFLVFSSVPT